MYEVELKVKATHEDVRDNLKTLNAEQKGAVIQKDTYYDAPDRSFAETDEALRIRSERQDGESTTILTYKGPLVDSQSKTRTEAETVVEDAESMADILSGLRYEPAATVQKSREYHHLDGCTVTLDTVDGLGEFVEVEYATDVEDEANIDRARERAVDVMEQLELDIDDQIRTSYLELLLEE